VLFYGRDTGSPVAIQQTTSCPEFRIISERHEDILIWHQPTLARAGFDLHDPLLRQLLIFSPSLVFSCHSYRLGLDVLISAA